MANLFDGPIAEVHAKILEDIKAMKDNLPKKNLPDWAKNPNPNAKSKLVHLDAEILEDMEFFEGGKDQTATATKVTVYHPLTGKPYEQVFLHASGKDKPPYTYLGGGVKVEATNSHETMSLDVRVRVPYGLVQSLQGNVPMTHALYSDGLEGLSMGQKPDPALVLATYHLLGQILKEEGILAKDKDDD